MNKDISEQALAEFFSVVDKRQQQEEKRQETSKRVIAEKNAILIPLRKMLARLQEAGVFVHHNAFYDYSLTHRIQAPQELKVWENESSPLWQPGSSIYLDHPAVMEIAVCNPKDRDTDGLIRISCTTPHPQANLLSGPFHTAEEACLALARFLAQSTIRVERGDDPVA